MLCDVQRKHLICKSIRYAPPGYVCHTLFLFISTVVLTCARPWTGTHFAYAFAHWHTTANFETGWNGNKNEKKKKTHGTVVYFCRALEWQRVDAYETKWKSGVRKRGKMATLMRQSKKTNTFLSLAAQTLNFYTNSPMSSLFERHYQNTMGSAILWNLLASCSITGTLLINWIIHPMGAMSSTKTNEGEEKKEGKRRRNFPSDSIPFCVLSLARSFFLPLTFIVWPGL